MKNMSKKDVEIQLREDGYIKIDKSFDYLLGMKIYNLTKDKLDEWFNNIEKAKVILEQYKLLDVKDIWKSELNELMASLGYRRLNTKNKKKMSI